MTVYSGINIWQHLTGHINWEQWMLADILRMEATMQAVSIKRSWSQTVIQKASSKEKKKLRAKELIKQCMINNSKVR